jgi:hypothetical protein
LLTVEVCCTCRAFSFKDRQRRQLLVGGPADITKLINMNTVKKARV